VANLGNYEIHSLVKNLKYMTENIVLLGENYSWWDNKEDI